MSKEIELVKKMIEGENLSQEIAEKYCPELKENSESEKIRKWLICTLKLLNSSPVQIDGAKTMFLLKSNIFLKIETLTMKKYVTS